MHQKQYSLPIRLFFLFVLTFFPKVTFAEPLDLESFLTLLETNNSSSVDDALKLLPLEMRKNYTLLYQGHGLRGTSYDEPGAILFGVDGRFMVTFGAADQALGNELEIMQFNDKTSRLELYRVSFPLQKDINGKIVRPEKNPAACTQCHNNDPKVIWNEYDRWPGVYGTNDDVVRHSDRRSPNLEGEKLQNFFQNHQTNDRYETLVDTPFKVMENRPAEHIGPYFQANPRTDVKWQSYSFRPNLRLNQLADRLNGRRLARKLIETHSGSALETAKTFCDLQFGDSDDLFAGLRPDDNLFWGMTPDDFTFKLKPRGFEDASSFEGYEGIAYRNNTIINTAISSVFRQVLDENPDDVLERSFQDNLSPDVDYGTCDNYDNVHYNYSCDRDAEAILFRQAEGRIAKTLSVYGNSLKIQQFCKALTNRQRTPVGESVPSF
jgi:hypothetical protein